MRNNFGALLAIAGALTLGSGSAAAQSHAPADIAPTSMGNDITPEAPRRSSYQATLDYAGCVAKADGARDLFMTQPGSRESAAAIAAAGDAGQCGKMPRGADLLRGALAERVYLKTYAAAPAEGGTPAPFTGSGKADLAMYDITRCAATRDPVGADMLIRSALRSDAEKAALARIVPVVGACTPSGGQVGFGREEMRGLIAEGLIATRAAQ
jgi:hypothetical protein